MLDSSSSKDSYVERLGQRLRADKGATRQTEERVLIRKTLTCVHTEGARRNRSKVMSNNEQPLQVPGELLSRRGFVDALHAQIAGSTISRNCDKLHHLVGTNNFQYPYFTK